VLVVGFENISNSNSNSKVYWNKYKNNINSKPLGSTQDANRAKERTT